MQISEIKNKMIQTWNSEVCAVIDTWQNYYVSLDDFKNSISSGFEKCKNNNGIAWIVDSSKATGNFSREIQNFIGTDVFPNFLKNGIIYFITIPAENPLTKLTVMNASSKAGPNGVTLVEVNNIESAIKFLKNKKLEK